MTTNNMGTPLNPEGLPHWTAKSMFAHRLRQYLANDRALMVGYFEKCDECPEEQDIHPTPTFENLLEGVVRIGVEEDFGNRCPDITLHRDRLPPRIIEIEDTNPLSEEKLADYRRRGVDVFSVEVHNRQDVLGHLRSPVWLWNAPVIAYCREKQRQRLRQLLRRLEETPDATFGVLQPRIDFNDPDWAEKHFEQSERRVVRRTTYEGELVTITRSESRPAFQKFVVADKTVSLADLLMVMAAVSVMADEHPQARELVPLSLYHMQALIRHQNGRERNVGHHRLSMADYPLDDLIEWESARGSLEDQLIYYERVFHFTRWRRRELGEGAWDQDGCPG